MISGLAVDVAGADEQPVLANLLQLYVHDFSELFTGTPRGDLSDDGHYAIDIPLDRWWCDADHLPFLIRLHGKLAGFALLNATPHGGASVDHNIAEFFVVRKYRRAGVGAAAAHALFSRYPGRWESAVMRRNTAARLFWERCIGAHPALTRIDIADRTHFSWDGTIFRFDIAPS